MIPALAALMIATCPVADADDNKPVREVVGGLFDGLKKDSSVRASAAVEKRFRLSDDERAVFLGRLDVLLQTSGALQTWKVVQVERMPGGDRWRTALIVSHHARRPVAWAIQLYRVAGGVWTILEISFDADDPAGFIRGQGGSSVP